MDIGLFGAEDDGIELMRLYGWLRADTDLNGITSVSLEGSTSHDTMSAAAMITVAATSMSSLAAVASSYVAWRSSRAKPPTVSVTINGSSPTEMPAEVTEIVQRLQALLDGITQAPGGSGDEKPT